MSDQTSTSEYLVIYEKTDTGYSAYVPDLAGCISTGPTMLKVKQNIQEAIGGHLSVMREYGDPIPLPTTTAELLQIPA